MRIGSVKSLMCVRVRVQKHLALENSGGLLQLSTDVMFLSNRCKPNLL